MDVCVKDRSRGSGETRHGGERLSACESFHGFGRRATLGIGPFVDDMSMFVRVVRRLFIGGYDMIPADRGPESEQQKVPG